MLKKKYRPFKIAYLDEDWILGRTSKPENLELAVNETLANPGEYSEQMSYWVDQSCWKADGRTCERIEKMISHFMYTGEIKQLN